MKRTLFLTLLLGMTQFGHAAADMATTTPAPMIPSTTIADVTTSALPKIEPVKIEQPKVEQPKAVSKAFATKIAFINMNEIKKDSGFAERYNKLETAYKDVLAGLQQKEVEIQKDVKAGKITEAELYGKSQQFEFEFRRAQNEFQKGVMELESKVNEIISEITKQEGWDSCQVQMFGYVNPDCDITPRVIKALEEKLKAEDAAEKFKKPATTVADAGATKTEVKPAAKSEKSDKPGVRPAPKKKSVVKPA